MRLTGPSGPTRGFITRLGQSTVAISTDPELPIGCPVDLSFQRPTDSEAVQCSGEVRRLIPDVGLWRGRPAALVELTRPFDEDFFGAQSLRGETPRRRGSEAGAPVPSGAGMAGSLRGGLGRRRRSPDGSLGDLTRSPEVSRSGAWPAPADVSEDDITAPPVRPEPEEELFVGSDSSDGFIGQTAEELVPADETAGQTDDGLQAIRDDDLAAAAAPAVHEDLGAEPPSYDDGFLGADSMVSAEVGLAGEGGMDLFGESAAAPEPAPKSDADFLAMFGGGGEPFPHPDDSGDHFGAGLGELGGALGELGGDLSGDPPPAQLDDAAVDFFAPGGIDDDAPPAQPEGPATDAEGYFQLGGPSPAPVVSSAPPPVATQPPPVQESLLSTGNQPPAQARQSAKQWRPEPPPSGGPARAPWESDPDISGASLIPRNARIESNLPVTFWARGRSNDAAAQNFSKEGLFLATHEPPPVRGAIVRIEFPIQGESDSVPIRFNAEVRWHRGDPGQDGGVDGFGVQILTFETPKDRQRYDEVLLRIIRLHRSETKSERGTFG